MIWIGIDTGDHTGFAVWNSESRSFVSIDTIKLHQALSRVLAWKMQGLYKVCVVFEDARQRKWFKAETSESEYRGKLMGAGAAKRDAKIWEEFLKDNKIPFIAQKPIVGATKWTDEAFARYTGWTGRTSEHSRDAALLVFGR